MPTVSIFVKMAGSMTYIEELFGLKGRTALVTGGYGHLGRAMCWALAAAGAKVYCAGPSREHFRERFPLAMLEALAAEYPEMGMADICYLSLDLASTASRKEALHQIYREEGGLDILINNAFFLGPLSDRDAEAAQKDMEQSPDQNQARQFCRDMDGLLNCTVALSEAARAMLQSSEQGRIINIASMYGVVAPDPGLYSEAPQQRSRASYNAAKAALIQLTRYWASFWGQQYPQLTVNTVSPGPFPAGPPATRKESASAPQAQIQGPTQELAAAASFRAELARRTIAGRVGQPEDLCGALLLLASRAGCYITGQNLLVDGGWTVR